MNASYEIILEEYITWLDTLGYSQSIVYSCKIRVRNFFKWLSNNHIERISMLTNKHIDQYHHYLETCPNKLFKGRLLGAAHINWYSFAIDKLLEFLHNYGMENAPVPTNHRLKIDPQERILKFEMLTQQEVKYYTAAYQILIRICPFYSSRQNNTN